MSSKLYRIRLGAILALLALFAVACGGRDDEPAADGNQPVETDDGGDDSSAPVDDADDSTGDDNATDDDSTADDSAADESADGEPTEEPTEEPAADPCEGAALEATDIGVSEDTITVVVMADVGSPLAPGLFQGSMDGVNAWADHVNANGGLGCRQIEVVEWDAQINNNETVNGFLKACEEAVALVGTTVLFSSNTEDQQTCPDAAGNAIGVPDMAYLVTEPAHQCSPNSFTLQRPGASCPYEEGVRDFAVNIGAASTIAGQLDEANGLFLIPSDLPSTIASSMPTIRGIEAGGVTSVGEFGVSGRATQADYTPIVQAVSDLGANFVYNGSNDQAMLKLQLEAAAQGLDASEVVWMCSLSCYTPDFIDQGGEAVDGTYVWTLFLPFDETDANQELADFIDAIGTPFPASWAAGAWASGVFFEDVINQIVAENGPNGITRQAILDTARTVTDFNANGMWGDTSFEGTLSQSPCYVILQVQGGEYVRVFPEARGERACDGELVELSIDPAAEYQG